MLLFLSALAAIISTISPFLGLVFILANGDKIWNRQSKYVFYLVFGAVVLFLKAANFIDLVVISDVVVGVGLASYFYLWSIYRSYDHQRSIVAVAFLNIGYAIIRQLVFGQIFLAKVTEMIAGTSELLKTNFQGSNEQLEMTLEMIDNLKKMLINYNPAIWVIVMVLAVYFGSLLLSKKMNLKWNHRAVRLPFALAYPLIGSLTMILFSSTRITGINGLMMLAPLFLIQGISILDYYWGDFFKTSKFMLYLLIFAMALNYFLLLLVAFIGMLDIWLNFRKISITEDINENHLS